jgi:5-methylthioribose kinase
MTSTRTAFDLTTEAGVEAYLATTPYPCTKAEALSGGTANFVFRLHLRQPHEGKNTLVLKHGRPYIKNWSTIPFDVKRQVDNLRLCPIKHTIILIISLTGFRGGSIQANT